MHVNGLATSSARPTTGRRIRAGLPDADVRRTSRDRDAGVLVRASRPRRPPTPMRALGSTDLIFVAGGGIHGASRRAGAGVARLRAAWDAAIVRQGAAARHDRRARVFPTARWSPSTATTTPARPRRWRPSPSPACRRCCFWSRRRRNSLRPSGQFRGIGIAGVARSRSRMDGAESSARLRGSPLGAPIAHYKVCSTFDSAPHVGSIGRAIDLAVPRLGGDGIRCWSVAGDGPLPGVRPSVRRGRRRRPPPRPPSDHVAPSGHADGRVRSGPSSRAPDRAKNRARRFVTMANGGADEPWPGARDGAEIISLDVLDQASLVEAGRLIWTHRGHRLFAVGSQGVEQALVAYWQSAGLIPDSNPGRSLSAVKRIACISGSCSPVTAAQIDHAAQHGFDIVRLDARAPSTPRNGQGNRPRRRNWTCSDFGRTRSAADHRKRPGRSGDRRAQTPRSRQAAQRPPL